MTNRGARIMLDLETLGTGRRPAVVQIGATAFDADGPKGATFFRRIRFDSAMQYGGVEADTLEWWLLQSEPARVSLVGQGHAKSTIPQALSDFWNWKCDDLGFELGVQIWGYGRNFDPPILGQAYVAAGRRVPWSHKDERDLRTLLDLYPVPEPSRSGTHHDALDDAMHQARWAALALQAHARATGGER